MGGSSAINQLENFFQKLITSMLGIDPTSLAGQNTVRKSWPTAGAPAWKITDDVVFLKVTNFDDPATHQFDTIYSEQDANNANQTISYMRAYRLDLILYGPNSNDNAEMIKNAFFSSTAFQLLLEQNNLSVIQDVNNPIRSPELFNGQWWERSNFYVCFYQSVTVQNAVPYIASAQVTTQTNSITQANVTVTTD
jgi:hypothetical protein